MTDTQLIVTTLVTVTLAFVGYLVTYLNSLRLAQRTERLERLNRQLAEFYGPLFALSEASNMAWDAFRKKHRPGVGYFDSTVPISEADRQAYRTWMQTVFMPTNLRMYECILSKSDLLIESKMPQCLLDLCAHVTAYLPVIRAWEHQDYSSYNSLIDYPDSVLEYARSSFRSLKAQQTMLIGHPVRD